MGESQQYMVGNIGAIESILLGRDPESADACDALLNDVEDAEARRWLTAMRDGTPIPWDDPNARAQRWETFAQVSGFLASVMRLNSRRIAFDAWPNALRPWFFSSNWYPLDNELAHHLACRPCAAVQFTRPPRNRLAWGPYAASHPHGFMRHDELPQMIRALHRFGFDAWRYLDAEENPFDTVAPGQSIEGPYLALALSIDDCSEEGWQLARATVAYNAASIAHDLGEDLITVGY